MARIIQNRYPIDSKERKAIGYGFPLNGSAVFTPTYTTKEQIKANLINFLLTNKGERVFRPNFGADLRSLIFQQVDQTTTDELEYRIQNSINKYFPEVNVREIKFNNNPDFNSINFILTYDVVKFGVNDEINIILQ